MPEQNPSLPFTPTYLPFSLINLRDTACLPFTATCWLGISLSWHPRAGPCVPVAARSGRAQIINANAKYILSWFGGTHKYRRGAKGVRNRNSEQRRGERRQGNSRWLLLLPQRVAASEIKWKWSTHLNFNWNASSKCDSLPDRLASPRLPRPVPSRSKNSYK